MRGSLWHLLLGALALGILLPVALQVPSGADSFTQTSAGTLETLKPFLGQGLLLLGVGAAAVWMFGSRGTGGM